MTISWGAIGILCCVFIEINTQSAPLARCKNGQRIQSEKFCDGVEHCMDGSDETVSACLHVRCPAFAFQCAYGACINGKAKCDGNFDCMDNSDETAIGCTGVLHNAIVGGNCPEGEFHCKSGECIQGYNACDGKKDCSDSSDETVEICAPYYCPSFAFRCGYGACVRGTAECDGIVDCLDGSDELCGKDVVNTTTTTTTQTSTESPTTTTTAGTVKIPRKGCRISELPGMTLYDSNGSALVPGSAVPQYTTITYKCSSKQPFPGVTSNLCVKGSWIHPEPKCPKNCPYIPLFGVTFNATCSFGGYEISCRQSLASGTRAKLACKPGYVKPNRMVHDEIVCDDQGEWDYSPYRCEPICGIVSTDEASSLKEKHLPWNVAVYDNLRNQICGGTIINAKIVLSAAHCFWDGEAKDELYVSGFEVAVGKHNRDYFAFDPNTQFFKPSEIYIHPDYSGERLYYQFDIALLVLNKFITFNDQVRPICIDWLSTSDSAPNRNLNGIVGGWGKASYLQTNELRISDFETVDYETCFRKTPNDYRNLITNDKFCVDNRNGEALCQGDSGAGFITAKLINGTKTFFLKGVISNALTNETTCEGSYCSTCTYIGAHANVIIEYETKYRPK